MLTWQVAVCASGPVTCATTPVASVLQDRHIFGQQQAVFADVPLRLDLVLVVRVYLSDGKSGEAEENMYFDDAPSDSGTWKPLTSSQNSMQTKAGVPEDNLTLVAWAFVPLTVLGKSQFLCLLLSVY